MTKRELIEVLRQWPDDTGIGLAIPIEEDYNDLVWMEILGIDQFRPNDSEYCLIYGENILRTSN